MEKKNGNVSGNANGNGNGNGNGKTINLRAFDYYERLKRIKEFVDENYGEEISLERAARVAAMERTAFSSFFRQKVGITFSEWLRAKRIARAIELIQSRDTTICEIAFEVGFGDLRTFERAFKLFTRMTPSEFRRMTRPS